MTVLDVPVLEPAAAAGPTRLSFRVPIAPIGFVDAAWWPHSRDLTVELPGLLDGLRTADREIVRISFSIDFWGTPPRRLTVDGRTIKLGGFHAQDPLLITLIDLWGRKRIEVLVLDPDIDHAVADRAMALAAAPGTHLHAADLMAQAFDRSQ